MLINQSLLAARVKKLFPHEKTLENVRSHTNLKYSESGAFLEFDVWIPSLQLAFEFQDDYHYVSAFYYQDSLERILYKDGTKRFLAHQSGETLILVPCWWDGAAESLAATIQYHRPELSWKVQSELISLNPPFGYFKSMDIPNIGDLMSASFPIGLFDVSSSSTKWWMGEKYDGVRYCWHPKLLRGYTRYGKAVKLPPAITRKLTPIFLDGEFWFGRGNYHFTSPLVIDSVDIVNWDLFRMISFDVPSRDVEKKPFEARYRFLIKNLPRHHPFLLIAPRVLCAGNIHLSLFVHGIINDGGEGTVMRAVLSLYERVRSPLLMKLKTTSGDKEAIVVEIDQAENAVVLKLPHGSTFSVPNEQVHVPGLAIGDIVSFSYDNVARRDIPVNPKIYRIRTDLDWQEVVYSSGQEEKYLTGPVVGFTTQPPNFWNKANMRKFMENAARAQHLDPLRAETWYSLPVSYIYSITSGRMIMQKLKGYLNALQELFPEIHFDKNSFARGTWYDIEARRKFFETYAKENNFNPLVPENWYSQPIEKNSSIKEFEKRANVSQK